MHFFNEKSTCLKGLKILIFWKNFMEHLFLTISPVFLSSLISTSEKGFPQGDNSHRHYVTFLPLPMSYCSNFTSIGLVHGRRHTRERGRLSAVYFWYYQLIFSCFSWYPNIISILDFNNKSSKHKEQYLVIIMHQTVIPRKCTPSECIIGLGCPRSDSFAYPW